MEKLLIEAGLKEVIVQIELNQTLEKHLKYNEEICEDCGGSGITVSDNRFGIKGIKSSDHPFPFRNEALRFCRGCYSGVRKRCEHCNKLFPKGWAKCECQYQIELKKKEDKHWENVLKITLDEALSKYSMLFVDFYDEYISSDDFEGWIEQKEDDDDFEVEKLRIFVTREHCLQLNAEDIIERELEDLHEDASVSDEEIAELQAILDAWVKRNESSTKTYHVDTSIGVVYK